jgi:hypothetical protein
MVEVPEAPEPPERPEPPAGEAGRPKNRVLDWFAKNPTVGLVSLPACPTGLFGQWFAETF